MKILKKYKELFESKWELILKNLKDEFGEITSEETKNQYGYRTLNITIDGIKDLYIYYNQNGVMVSSQTGYKHSEYIDDNIIEFIYEKIGGSMLIYFINKENWDKVIELIPTEKRINAQNYNGYSALHLLLMYEYDVPKKLILKREDLDIELKNNIGETPLLTAANNLGSDMFLLVRKGANLLTTNKYGKDFEYILRRQGFDLFLNDFLKYIEEHKELENCKEYIKVKKRKKFNL